MVAAFAFLAAYAIPIISPAVSPLIHTVCDATSWTVWSFFVIDYVVRLALADDKKTYLRSHVLDVIIIALPLLRPLRLLRIVTMLRFLDGQATMKLRGRMLSYVLGGSALLGFVGSLAVLDAERDHAEANITEFGDALWWAVTTMTTVGYGEYFPVTGAGRLAAVGLMIGGITILGTVTATLASWMVERIRDENLAQTEEEQRPAKVQVVETSQQ